MNQTASSDIRTRLQGLPRAMLWVMAARFKTVSLSVMPVLAGAWLAAGAGQFRADIVLAAMVSAAAIQIGTNLWNDAADAARGVDRADRLGPPRMTALGLLAGAAVQRAALGAFGVAVLAGLYLVGIGGWPIIAIGLCSLAFGYLYSMGPRPLSGLPFGEALVILFFGLVAVSGTVWLQGLDPVAPRVLLTGAMIGLPAAAVLMLNNHRDRAQDARAGRRTLAIVIGDPASRLFYFGCLLAALLPAYALGARIALIFPAVFALWLGHAMWHWAISPRLNRLIAQTAAFQMLLLLVTVFS